MSRKFQISNFKFQIFLLVLIIIGFSARLIPHPANFAPIGALALFAGLYLPKKWALVLPLITMFLSDIIIGFYNPKIMVIVYLSFALTVSIGMWVQQHKKFYTILGGTLISSVIFFLATNTAVWAFGTMYTHNVLGLLQSYYMALPFFRNSLLGDLFFVGILVGTTEFALHKLTSYFSLHTPYETKA